MILYLFPEKLQLHRIVIYFSIQGLYPLYTDMKMMSEVNDVVEDYTSSLQELVANSKPHITNLTIVADEAIQYAPAIVETIERHLQKVNIFCLFVFFLLSFQYVQFKVAPSPCIKFLRVDFYY